MKKTKRSWLAGIVVLVLLGIIFLKIKPARLLEAVAGVNWDWVALAVVLNLVNIGAEALRWQQVIQTVKKKASLKNILSSFLVGFFGNIVFPLRLGDGFRVYFLSRHEKIKVPDVIWTFVVDRLVDLSFFLIIIAVTGLFFPLSGETERAFHLILLGAMALLATLLALAYFSSRRQADHLTGWKRRLRSFVDRLLVIGRGLVQAKNLSLVSFWAIASWLLRWLIVWTMLKAFHLNLPPVAGIIGLIMINLGLAAVNTPANVGGFELALVAALKLFSVETETALSCSLLLHLVEVVPVFILGGLVVIKSGFKPGEARKEAEEIEESLEEAV